MAWNVWVSVKKSPRLKPWWRRGGWRKGVAAHSRVVHDGVLCIRWLYILAPPDVSYPPRHQKLPFSFLLPHFFFLSFYSPRFPFFPSLPPSSVLLFVYIYKYLYRIDIINTIIYILLLCVYVAKKKKASSLCCCWLVAYDNTRICVSILVLLLLSKMNFERREERGGGFLFPSQDARSMNVILFLYNTLEPDEQMNNKQSSHIPNSATRSSESVRIHTHIKRVVFRYLIFNDGITSGPIKRFSCAACSFVSFSACCFFLSFFKISVLNIF